MSEIILIQCPQCQSKIRIPKGKYITFTCQKCNNKLEYDDRSLYKKIDDSKGKKNISSLIIYLLTLIIAFPITIILYQFLPVIDGFYKYEKIVLFVILTSILGFIFKKFNNLILVSFVILLMFLSYGSLQNRYGFSSLLLDYKTLMSSLIRSPKPQEVIITSLNSFKNKTEIINAIDYKNSAVRSFALSAISENNFHYDDYNDYRTIIQCFAVFKKAESKWNYVSDPEDDEYFAKASETVSRDQLSGDCDDYSILIAACTKSIGGKSRLIRTKGHLYPELFVGDKKDLQNLDYIISKDIFKAEVGERQLHYHIDEAGGVWLNLDYTANYPGGKFMDNAIVGVLNL